MGKWLHPQLFADYNPREAYQEYLTRFLGLDLDVVDKGVFVYPEP
jgi:iron complex transport system substrate-binding protein